MSEKPSGVPSPADFLGWVSQMMMAPLNAVTAAAPASVPVPGDPLAIWKNLTEKNQETWSKFFQQVVAAPEFAQGLGRSACNTAAYRKQVRQAAKIYLETANIPSLDDLSRVAEQIVQLDAKVDNVEDALADNLPVLTDRIVSTLETLSNRLERLEAKIVSHPEQPELDPTHKIESRLEALEQQLSRLETLLAKATITLAPPEPSLPTETHEILDNEAAIERSVKAVTRSTPRTRKAKPAVE